MTERPIAAASLGGDTRRFFPPGLAQRFALLLCAAFVAGVAMTLLALWGTSHLLVDEPLSSTAYIAAIIGGGLSMVMGAALMAALFYSDRSRWDEHVTQSTMRR